MARVHLVIVNYNTAGLLRRCLAHSYASITNHPFDVTVVDNGSSDGSMALLRDEYPQATAIRSERNLGFSGGNNLALRPLIAAIPPDAPRDHEYVLLVNSDLFLAPDTIETLVAFAEAHPKSASSARASSGPMARSTSPAAAPSRPPRTPSSSSSASAAASRVMPASPPIT